MVSHPTPRAVVFDLDGTLIDSAPDIATAINAVLGESGHRRLTLGEVRDMVGDGTRALVERSGFFESFSPIDGQGCGGKDFSWTAAMWLAVKVASILSNPCPN